MHIVRQARLWPQVSPKRKRRQLTICHFLPAYDLTPSSSQKSVPRGASRHLDREHTLVYLKSHLKGMGEGNRHSHPTNSEGKNQPVVRRAGDGNNQIEEQSCSSS